MQKIMISPHGGRIRTDILNVPTMLKRGWKVEKPARTKPKKSKTETKEL